MKVNRTVRQVIIDYQQSTPTVRVNTLLEVLRDDDTVVTQQALEETMSDSVLLSDARKNGKDTWDEQEVIARIANKYVGDMVQLFEVAASVEVSAEL